MRRWTVLVGSALLVCGAFGEAVADLPAGGIPRGGVTFDFSKISAARFHDIFNPARNLIKNPPAGKLNGVNNYSFPVPTTNGGAWRVSCRYRMRHLKTEYGTREFFQVKGGYGGYRIPESPLAWGVLSDVTRLKPGEKEVKLCLRISPPDEVEFEIKDVTMVEATQRDPIEITGTVWDRLDGTFVVSEGQCSALEMAWRKRDDVRYSAADFSARVELPPGVEYVGASYADAKTVKTEKRRDGSSVTTFRLSEATPMPGKRYVSWNTLVTVVRATRGKGKAGTGRIFFSGQKDGKTVEAKTTPIVFRVMPRIAPAKIPQTYQNGVLPGDALGRLGRADADGQAALVKAMAEYGVTWIGERGTPEAYRQWRSYGIRAVTPAVDTPVNGYQVGSWERTPASDKFMTVDSKTGEIVPNDSGVCPVTVYEGSEFFRNETVPMLQRELKGSDGAWANWEPESFYGKGCFCDRCCRKFADFVGKPYDEIKATWPACVRKGGVWFDRIRRFRALEHAKLVKTLDRVVREATGGENSRGLIPAVSWTEMSSWWHLHNDAAEVQETEYAGAMQWMCPWGPYAAWEADHPYEREKRKPLCHFCAAKDVRETVNADYPAGARPKLMALPQGHQCGHWLAQPEWIGMALDSYFFHGFEATVLYYFPRGYDARWWERFADATTRAAKYEPFVREGTSVDASVRLTPLAKAYAAPVRYLSGYLPKTRDVSPLQAKAYRRDGRVIVAVMNFWEKGEAFFRLSLAGLTGPVTIVDEPGVLRAKSRKEATWDASTLAGKGVVLAVPAARTVVFEFRPGEDFKDARRVLTDETVLKTFRARQADLEKAAAEDAETESAGGPVQGDWMPMI